MRNGRITNMVHMALNLALPLDFLNLLMTNVLVNNVCK